MLPGNALGGGWLAHVQTERDRAAAGGCPWGGGRGHWWGLAQAGEGEGGGGEVQGGEEGGETADETQDTSGAD